MSVIDRRQHPFSRSVVGIAFVALLLGCASDGDRADREPDGEPTHESAASGAESGGAHDDRVILAAEDLEEFGIEVRTAGPGELRLEKSYPGEVRVNQDRHAHVVPRVAGIVRAVYKSLGDEVTAGEPMAMLESRELADAKASYLADLERLGLAQSNFDREERLYKKEISSEQEYLAARQALAEARIALRSASQKLRALGFSEGYIQNLPQEPEASLIQYPLTAPLSGTIVEKHITQGEALEADAQAFEVADLATVWVDLSIYQKDMGLIQEGQDVVIESGDLHEPGKIAYVRPIVGEDTRTSLARIVLPNNDGRWKPGMFVTGVVSVDSTRADIIVSRSAVQVIEGRSVVFVRSEGAFEPHQVTIGAESSDQVEITSGLRSGAEYAASGSFSLKVQMNKDEMSAGHDH